MDPPDAGAREHAIAAADHPLLRARAINHVESSAIEAKALAAV
jgi:hypothetical protein